MKKYLYLLVLVSNIVFAIDKHNLQQEVQQKIEQNAIAQKCGIPGAIGGGIMAAAGYLGSAAVTGDFKLSTFGVATTAGALGGAACGLGNAANVVWRFNGALGTGMLEGLAEKIW